LTKIKTSNLNKVSYTHANTTPPIPAFAKLALKPVTPKTSSQKAENPTSPKSWGSEKSDQKSKNDAKVLKSGEKITTFYTAEILRNNVPLDVDLKNKELYLSIDNFKVVFNMDIISFNKLPQWKRDMLKKDVGLF
jgi:hypothetical protein